MKRSERITRASEYIKQQIANGLKDVYPNAIARSKTEDLTDLTEPEKLFQYEKAYKRAKENLSPKHLHECIKEYMDLEEHFTFYLNWTGDQSGASKEMINVPFYDFIETVQNLEFFENYYVAYKIPKKGKVGMKEKHNIRVDVIARY